MDARAAAWALAALVAAAPGNLPAAGAPELRGTYRLSGTARVEGTAGAREVELHADAILEPGAGPGEVRVRIEAEGASCTFAAALGEGGALRFAAGQRCTVEPTGAGVRGKVDAVLRSGRGALGGDRLRLELAGDVSGALRLRGDAQGPLGVELPDSVAPEVPVRGRASAIAEGRRDRSRAAGP